MRLIQIIVALAALAATGCQAPFRWAASEPEKQRLAAASYVSEGIVRDGTPPESVAAGVVNRAVATAAAKAGRPAEPINLTDLIPADEARAWATVHAQVEALERKVAALSDTADDVQTSAADAIDVPAPPPQSPAQIAAQRAAEARLKEIEANAAAAASRAPPDVAEVAGYALNTADAILLALAAVGGVWGAPRLVKTAARGVEFVAKARETAEMVTKIMDPADETTPPGAPSDAE